MQWSRRSAGSTCACVLSVSVLAGWFSTATAESTGRQEQGITESGASYLMKLPPKWNKTVLVFSHGYNPGPSNPPSVATKESEEELLKRGFALIGSSYATTGWAVEDAVRDQLATLDKFEQSFGHPKTVIAWGSSMGGLVTIALLEKYPHRFSAGLPMCGSVGGALGMMNGAFDAAYVLTTLIHTPSPPHIIHVSPPAAPEVLDETQAVKVLIESALATPEGHARATLAAVIAQVPPWTDPKKPEPDAGDFEARQTNMIRALPFGSFFPRSDIERRAGGNVSWNEGINYETQLEKTGQRQLVEEAYRRAKLDLSQDLATLAASPRVALEEQPADYLLSNYTPSGRLSKPVLAVHTMYDPLTTISHERSFQDAVAKAGRKQNLRVAVIREAGHCNFTAQETVASIEALEFRVKTGSWRMASEQALNHSVQGLGGQGRFVPFEAVPMLRECSQLSCPGLLPAH
jgi:pimeloyl-ACP methyl ester carboxylesterase